MCEVHEVNVVWLLKMGVQRVKAESRMNLEGGV